MSGKSFVKGALVLSLAGIIGKLLGALYRIPFNRIVGEEGAALYGLSYPLYSLLLALSTAGIPLAVSKMIAECEERKARQESFLIFRIAVVLLALVGLGTAAMFFLSADWIALHLLHEPRAAMSLKALAPAMLFTCLMAVFRGYFQGRQEMIPTAISQVLEQFFRVGTIFLAIFAFSGQAIEVVVAGASFGATIGGLVAFCFLLAVFLFVRRREATMATPVPVAETLGKAKIAQQLFYLAIPISIGALVLPIMQLIDSVMVIPRLMAAGLDHGTALVQYGYLSSYAAPIINLPFILTTAISASLVPAIAEAMAGENKAQMQKDFGQGMQIAVIIVFPAAVGLILLGTPICALLYETAGAGPVLSMLAPTVCVVGLYQVSSGALQGLGKVLVPMHSLLVGALAKAVLTYILPGIPGVGAQGAALATVLGFLIALAHNLWQLSKEIGFGWFAPGKHLLKPLLSVGVMALVVVFAYQGLMGVLARNSISTLVSISLGGVVYFFVLLVSGGIDQAALATIPKVGPKLARLIFRQKNGQEGTR